MLPLPSALPAPPGTVVRRLSDVSITLPVGLATRVDAPPAPPALELLTAELRRELKAGAH